MSVFLETSRLILKPTRHEDANQIIHFRADHEVMQYVGDGKAQTKLETYQFIEKASSYYEQYGMGICSLFTKDSNIFIGQAGLMHLGFNTRNTDIEISYRLYKEYWGNGYATEIVLSLVDWAFKVLTIDQLIAITYPANIASQRVLSKCGFQYQKTIYWFSNTALLQYKIEQQKQI